MALVKRSDNWAIDSSVLSAVVFQVLMDSCMLATPCGTLHSTDFSETESMTVIFIPPVPETCLVQWLRLSAILKSSFLVSIKLCNCSIFLSTFSCCCFSSAFLASCSFCCFSSASRASSSCFCFSNVSLASCSFCCFSNASLASCSFCCFSSASRASSCFCFSNTCLSFSSCFKEVSTFAKASGLVFNCSKLLETVVRLSPKVLCPASDSGSRKVLEASRPAYPNIFLASKYGNTVLLNSEKFSLSLSIIKEP